MVCIPEQLMMKTLTNVKMWAQHVKQFLMLMCDVETKSQEDMNRGGHEHYMMFECSR